MPVGFLGYLLPISFLQFLHMDLFPQFLFLLFLPVRVHFPCCSSSSAEKLVEHIAIAHGKLGRFLPLATWNYLKYNRHDFGGGDDGGGGNRGDDDGGDDGGGDDNGGDDDGFPSGEEPMPALLLSTVEESKPAPSYPLSKEKKKLLPKKKKVSGETGNGNETSDTGYTCFICQRRFGLANKMRQHYATAHFSRQLADRFTRSRKLSSHDKETCFFCPHVARPRHMLEHLRHAWLTEREFGL
jgi:hypothetical protein